MATRNQKTGLYEARKLLSTGHEYVGVGETKEDAKSDLAKQLKEIEIDYGPYQSDQQRQIIQAQIRSGRIPKYNPPMKQIGTIRSPGFELKMGENGTYKYEFNPDRVAPVMSKDLTAREALDAAKGQVNNN